MTMRTLSAIVLSTAAAALIGGALSFAPAGQAAPGGDVSPACLAEGTCAMLTPPTPARYLPLTPTANASYAPLTPAPADTTR
jgi:hypothetical protein